MLKPPDFKQSRETQIIADLFADITNLNPQLITLQELTKATGKSLSQIRGAIATAIRWVRKNHSLVIESDRNIGYRLRKDNELTISGQSAIDRSRRVQRVGLQKMECADLSRLTPEEKSAHNVRKSALELMLLASRPRTIANVDQMVTRKHNQLDEHEMLTAIKEALSK